MDGSESFATVAAGGNNREPAPPTWDGSDPAINYQVFEKNVRYWQYESELDKKKQGVRLLRGLTGLARASVDSLEFDQVATEKGVENIMKRFKEEFAPHLEVSLPRAFEKAIYGQPRSHKETMQEYLLRADRAFFMLTKEGVTLPDAAVGYVLYRQASLTESQDLRFSAWAQGKYDRVTVTTCLRKLDKVVAEKSKSSGTFLQEEDGDGSEHEAYPVEFEDQKDEDQFVYVEEGDMDKIYDEDEIQIVLATYQEVRKAIQSSQKGRRFWKGKGRGSPGQDFFKNKKKIHIEQLKLRTRCARCGNIGHWAKECKNEPDGKGKSYQGSTASSVKAPSSAGQSWYVSTGFDGCSNSILDTNFGVWCRGDCTEDEVLGTHQVDKWGFAFHEDEPLDGQLRGSETVFRGPKGLVFEKGHDGSCCLFCLFIGLTTSPSTAVVDTAAQDGLIGRPALERLKQQLGAIGLRISWTKKKAKAHGVGGPAKVVGIAAIPLGLAGTTGILETTVVENDVPLLLPVTLLGSLQAVIDVHAEKMLFRRLDRTVDLIRLPSGHLAVDVLNFGTEGYKHPTEAIHAGLGESDFRCGSGSEVGDTMFTIVHRFLVMSDRLALFRRAFNRPAADAPMDPVERPKRNSKRAIARWRQVLDKAFCLQQLIGLEESVNSWLPQALGDPKHSQLSSKQLEEYVATAESMKPLQGKVAATKMAAECQHPAERLTMGGNQYGSWVICWDCHSRWKAPPYHVRETKKAKAKPAAMPASSAEEFKSQQAKEQIAKEIRAEFEEKFQVHAKKFREDVQQTRLDAQKNVGVLQSELREAAKMAVLNDIMMSEYAEMSMGKTRYEEHKGYYDGEMFGMAERKLAFREEMQALTELQEACREIPSQMTEGPGQHTGCGVDSFRSEERPSEVSLTSGDKETWVRLKGEGAKERMRALEEGAYYEIAELYIEGVEGGRFAVNYAEELEDGEHYVVKMRPTIKTLVEDEISEVEETALPKKTKTRLRRVEGQVRRVEGLQGERRVEGEQGGTFAVDVAEVYSPPRIASTAGKAGLNAGGSYDIQTGYDLGTPQGVEAMWNGLVEEDPELAVLCPPCTPFSVLQSLNYDRMPLVKALGLLGEGLHHLDVAAEVALRQYYRGKIFLFEHPLGSKAWSEESMEHIMQLPGVFVCRTDMCRYGMRVRDGLNLKPTRWVTNSWEIAKELQRRCNGGHQHETLMGGKAAAAAVYPPQLCQAVVRGLRRHLRAQGKLSEVKLEESHVIEVMAVRRQLDEEGGDDDLDVFEDILPEEVEQY